MDRRMRNDSPAPDRAAGAIVDVWADIVTPVGDT